MCYRNKFQIVIENSSFRDILIDNTFGKNF